MSARQQLILTALLGLAALGCQGRRSPAPPELSTAIAPTLAVESGDLGPPVGQPIEAVLTDAPNVPPAIHRNHPAKVIVNLEVQEVEGELADGVKYTFWTFGGKVPGKFIRVREGDTVELHLRNASGNKMPHNIDLHAVTGPGGGAEATFTAPGHESQFTFKAVRSGVFVYHCATAPVGMHIANGMYGMILVEPPEGLPPVDREYYVMQGDFYTTGRTGEAGQQAFDFQKAVDEKPTYVLFNGREGSLIGDHALQAKAGERVRIFVGNGGPNLISSFHIIGEIFDHVYPEGASAPEANVQTTLVPAGGATIVDFRPQVPGTYSLVDHAIFRAFNKGAIAQLKVTGPENPTLYSGAQPVAEKEPSAPSAATAPAARAAAPSPAPAATPAPASAPASASLPAAVPAAMPAGPAAVAPVTLNEQMDAGHRVFSTVCAACHQADAKGIPNAIPPLAGSDFLMADKLRAVHVVTRGLTGPVTVNGASFNSAMPPLRQLSDADVANVLTFVRNSFGNHGDAVKANEVAKVRDDAAGLARN